MTPINPGIRATVEWLNQRGFHTTDSGDGETHDFGCDQSCPYVHMLTKPSELVSETDRLFRLLEKRGITMLPMNENATCPSIEASYNPADGIGGVITLWNVRM